MEQKTVYIKTHLAGNPGGNITFTDVRNVWEILQKQNLTRILLINKVDPDYSLFLSVLLKGRKYVSFFYEYETDMFLGLAWLQQTSESAGLVHFTPVREGKPIFDQLALTWLEEMFIHNNPSGVSFIYGHIPCRYTGVLKAAERLGFVDTGQMRKYVLNREDGTQREYPAKVLATHVRHLRKHLAMIPNPRAVVVPTPPGK